MGLTFQLQSCIMDLSMYLYITYWFCCVSSLALFLRRTLTNTVALLLNSLRKDGRGEKRKARKDDHGEFAVDRWAVWANSVLSFIFSPLRCRKAVHLVALSLCCLGPSSAIAFMKFLVTLEPRSYVFMLYWASTGFWQKLLIKVVPFHS